MPYTKYIMFQGAPFAEEDYGMAIKEVQEFINNYNPALLGYSWDNENPRIQLEPIGARGYIELRAIK